MRIDFPSPLSPKSFARAASRALAAGLLAWTFVPTPATAQVVAGDPVTIASQTSVRAVTADVAVKPNGAFVAVWDRYVDYSSSNVFMRRFAADGSPLGKAVLVTSASGSEAQPSVALAEDGRILVAWTVGISNISSDIYAQIFASDGTPLADPFLVNYGDRPSATNDGDGFAIAFQPGGVIRLDANGNVRGAFVPDDGDNIQVRGLSASRLAVVWSSTHEESLSHDSEGPVGRVDGVVLSPSDEVIGEFRTHEPRPRTSYDYLVDGARRISIATSADGSIAIAHDTSVPRYLYNTDAHDGPFTLGARLEVFGSDAMTRSTLYLGDDAPQGVVADVAMTAGGNIVASVETGRIGVRAIDCRGVVLGDGLDYLSTEGIGTSGSSIAINERGDGVVVWSATNPHDYSVRARRFHVSGGCSLCGDADGSGSLAATDALLALRTAVGLADCGLDRCDVDGSSKVRAIDALRILRAAVDDSDDPLPCSDGPGINLSDSIDFVANYYGWESPFSLIAAGDGAVLTWSDAGIEGGSTVARRVSLDLDLDPEQTVAGPEMDRGHYEATGCSNGAGVAHAWASERYSYPEGITLDLSTIHLSIPDGPVVQLHPDSIGAHRFGSVACLSEGRYAVSWMSKCGGVELVGDDPADAVFIRPPECDAGLPDGAQVRVIDADGSPIGDAQNVLVSDNLHQETAVVAAGDRFVVAAGPVLKVLSNDGDLLDETSIETTSTETSLACLGTKCVRADGERIFLFDAADADSIREIVVRPEMHLGPYRSIVPHQFSVACEPGGTCILAWVERDMAEFPDYWVAPDAGVFVRAFDLATGELGSLIRLPGERGQSVAAAAPAPGVFLVATSGTYRFTIRRIVVN